MPMYLKITDGTTTLDLLGNDAANDFHLMANSWGPAVATRRKSAMGNQSPYNDVVESIPLDVASTTNAATVLDNINVLAGLIDQAERWYKGENVAPVIIRYSPNSSSAYYQAVILGPPDGDESIALPPNFVDDLYQNLVQGITLQFKRRGLWLGDENAQSSTSGNVGNKQEITFTNSFDILCPADLKITFDDAITPQPNIYIPEFYFMLGRTDQIHVVDAYSLTATQFTSSVEATAYGGNTLDFTAAVASQEYFSADEDLTGFEAKQIHVFVRLRNQHATTQFDIRMAFHTQSDGNKIDVALTPTHTVDNSTTNVRMVYLGMVSLPRVPEKAAIGCIATATSGTLEFDEFVFVSNDAHIISSQAAILPGPAGAVSGYEFHINHNLLSEVAPESSFVNNTGSTYTTVKSAYTATGVDGDKVFMIDDNNDIGTVFFSVDPLNGSLWRFDGAAGGGAVMDCTITLTRRYTYLIPQ